MGEETAYEREAVSRPPKPPPGRKYWNKPYDLLMFGSNTGSFDEPDESRAAQTLALCQLASSDRIIGLDSENKL
jgi:hypothetical protein